MKAVAVVAINCNPVTQPPHDSPKRFEEEKGSARYTSPYL